VGLDIGYVGECKWREGNLGSTRKFVQNYLLFTCISNQILAMHTQSVNRLKEPFAGVPGGTNLGYPAQPGLIGESVCL
jgi:hypothetical protein